jgi:hypothetical protein
MISLVDLLPYRFSELGWLQFERLCELLVEGTGHVELEWVGRADRGRIAQLTPGARLVVGEVSVDGPVTLAVVWTRAWGDPARGRVLASQLRRLTEERAPLFGGRVVVMSNLTRHEAGDALDALPEQWQRPVIICVEDLGSSLDQSPALRAAMPSVLGGSTPTPKQVSTADPRETSYRQHRGAEDFGPPASTMPMHGLRNARSAAPPGTGRFIPDAVSRDQVLTCNSVPFRGWDLRSSAPVHLRGTPDEKD